MAMMIKAKCVHESFFNVMEDGLEYLWILLFWNHCDRDM